MIPVPGQDDDSARYGLFSLEVPEQEKARLLRFLSPSEIARGNRLVDPIKRDHFLTGRGILREVVGDAAGLAPQAVEFSEGEFGKPRLAGRYGADAIAFNVSHAGRYLLVALCRGREIGVDLEAVRQDLAFRPMAERYFSLRERQELFGLPPREQLAAFYRCWTRKEAYLKSTGSGFSQDSTGFDVSLLPADPPALLAHRRDAKEAGRWQIVDLPVPEGYCAALAIERL